MKRIRIAIDMTNPARPFVHKGGRRKGHTYVMFYTNVQKGWTYADWTGALTGNAYIVPAAR